MSFTVQEPIECQKHGVKKAWRLFTCPYCSYEEPENDRDELLQRMDWYIGENLISEDRALEMTNEELKAFLEKAEGEYESSL